MPLSVRLRGTLFNLAYNPLARLLGYDALLGSVYNDIDQKNFARAHEHLATAQLYLTRHSHTARHKLYEASGDLDFAQGNFSGAYHNYHCAFFENSDPFLGLKCTAAAVAAATNPQSSAYEKQTHRAQALKLLSCPPAGRPLPRWGLMLRQIFRIQLSGPAEGTQLLHRMVQSQHAQKFSHALVAWETLQSLENFPTHAVWQPMIAAFYGDPTHLLPHPRDIRWRFATPACEPFNCSTLALDHGILLNDQLTENQKLTAAAALWCRTIPSSTLHQWADNALARRAPAFRRQLSTSYQKHIAAPPTRGSYEPVGFWPAFGL